MNLAMCTEKISDTEKELRKMAATLISSGPTYDTAVVSSLLKQAELLLSVYRSLMRIKENADSTNAMGAFDSAPSPQLETLDESLFPVVFYRDDKIFRIGLSADRNSDGDRYTWWKSVSREDAMTIMDVIYKHLEVQFKLSDIAHSVHLPPYRVDVVLVALRKIGAIKSIGSQGYNEICDGTPLEWLDSIKQLPIRSDLLLKGKPKKSSKK